MSGTRSTTLALVACTALPGGGTSSHDSQTVNLRVADVSHEGD